jgi:type I restriction-modification system DNA methylase subunit
MAIKKSELYSSLWKSCDELRGGMDASQDLNKAQYEFNGSSHDYLCQQFMKEFNTGKFELKENYRSSRAVIIRTQTQHGFSFRRYPPKSGTD